MLTLLEATEIQPNKGRVNIFIKARAEAVALDGAREGAEALSSCDGKLCKVESRHNKIHKAMLAATKSFLRPHDSGYMYKFEVVTINTNHAAAKHTGSNNPYIIGFVGDTPHYVKPFKGTRYTLAYYH